MNNYYTEWFNANEGRAYPVSESASRIDDQGVRMSDGLLADMQVVVPDSYGGIMITSLSVSRFTASIGISALGTGLLIGTYVRSQLRPYIAYPLVGVVDNVSGWVVFGNAMTDDQTRTHKFSTVQQSALETKVIQRISPPKVRRFLKYGGRSDVWLDGDVRLACNANLRIFQDQTAPTPTVEIGLDPLVASQMAGPCLKAASKNNCGAPPIRTINGVQADNTGKITVEFE